MSLTWIELSPSHAVALRDSLVFQVWEGVVDDGVQLQCFHRMERLSKQLVAKGEPLFVLAIVSEHTNMPSAECRAVGARFPQYFRYYVGVHEGSGFRASLVRTVIAGMAMASRVKARYSVVSTLAEGARDLELHSQGAFPAAQAEADIRAMREAIAGAKAHTVHSF